MEDNEFRELQERSHLILELTSLPGWIMLMDRANEGIWAKHNLVMSGKLPNFEQYKTTIAWMDGAQYVLAVPDMVQQELNIEQLRRDELELALKEEED